MSDNQGHVTICVRRRHTSTFITCCLGLGKEGHEKEDEKSENVDLVHCGRVEVVTFSCESKDL